MKGVSIWRVRAGRGFTLVELLVAIAVLSIILFFLGSAIGFVSQTWSSGMGTTDNYMKARTILSTIDRDVQMMVLRPDVAAFRDNTSTTPSSCAPLFAFYTNAEGAPGGDNRAASLVQYGMDSDATPLPVLLRFSSGLNFTAGTLNLPPPAQATDPAPTSLNPNPMTPGLNFPASVMTTAYSSASGTTDPVSTGVILFQWQFIDGAGNVLNPPYTPMTNPASNGTTPFTYDFTSPSTSSNPRTVVVSMVVLSNSAYQLVQSRGTTLVTLQHIFGTTPGANETYGHYWNAQYNNTMAAPPVPAPVMAGLRVFERHIPLPGASPSSS